MEGAGLPFWPSCSTNTDFLNMTFHIMTDNKKIRTEGSLKGSLIFGLELVFFSLIHQLTL